MELFIQIENEDKQIHNIGFGPHDQTGLSAETIQCNQQV